MNDWLINMKNGVAYLTPPSNDFEQAYIDVRSKENRVHDDVFVKNLPNVPKTHPHYKEWEKRKWTLSKFLKYLKQDSPKSILEIGCGNGWLSQQIAPHSKSVFGLDVGQLELEQAARCSVHENVHYLCCSDWNLLPETQFDRIVFAGSFQYFEITPHFWKQLYRLLKVDGEIHILDTQFYSKVDTEGAKKRSEDYFSKIGNANASDYYYHQDWDALPENFVTKYIPSQLNKVFRNRSPFPWVCVYKPA